LLEIFTSGIALESKAKWLRGCSTKIEVGIFKYHELVDGTPFRLDTVLKLSTFACFVGTGRASTVLSCVLQVPPFSLGYRHAE
jgi:hypothetical protein